MKMPGTGKYSWLVAFALLAGLFAILAAKAGSFLIIDAPGDRMRSWCWPAKRTGVRSALWSFYPKGMESESS